MNPVALDLITIGGLLLLAVAVEALGRRTRLPRISLLVALGFLLGPAVLNVIDPQANAGFTFIATFALAMVGFLVGGQLTRKLFHEVGRGVLWISLWESLITFLAVAAGFLLLSQPLEIALLVAAIATATDPAATLEAIRDSGKRNRFSDTLTGIVAIDDAWSLILFSIALLVLQGTGGGDLELNLILQGLAELFGAALLGLLLGIPMALLSGRIRKGQPTLLEVLGMVLLCAGIAQWLSLSYLLACVTLGATVANLAKHHRRPFTTIEEIDWPFLALFFIFSGAYLGLDAIIAGGWLCLGYLVFRLLGRVAAGFIAAIPRWIDTRHSRWMGVAMLPQGGVALAMAFVAARSYPAHAPQITAIIITAIFVFELFGPIASRYTLNVHNS